MKTIYYAGVMMTLGVIVLSVVGGYFNTMLTLDNRSHASNEGTAFAPQGALDIANVDSCHLVGWVVDLDAPDQSQKVHLYLDKPFNSDPKESGTYLGEYQSDQVRADVNKIFKIGGTYGFAIDLAANPAMPKDHKVHKVYVYAIDANGGSQSIQLTNSPHNVECPAVPAKK